LKLIGVLLSLLESLIPVIILHHNMTPQEQQILQYGKMSGRTQEETLAALARFRMEQNPVERAPSFMQKVGQTIKEAPGDLRSGFGGMVDAVSGGIQTAQDVRGRVETGETTPLAGTYQTMGAGFAAGGGAIFEGLKGVGKAFLPKSTEEAIGGKVESAVETVAETPTAQKIGEWYGNLTPEQQRNVIATLGVGEGLTTMFGVPGASKLTGVAGRTVKGAIDSKVSATGKSISDFKTKTIESIQDLRQNAPQRFEEAKTTVSQAGLKFDQPVETLKTAIQKSFVDNNKTVTTKLKSVAARESVEVDDLIQRIAERGYVPTVKGSLADFSDVRKGIDQQKRAIIDNEVLPRVNQINQTFSLDDISRVVDDNLRKFSRGADLNKTLAEKDRIFDSYRNLFGSDDLTPAQMNRVRVEMNAATNAFKREAWEIDTEDAIAKAVRQRFDEIDPGIREANAKYADLMLDQRLVSILDNNKINVGMFGGAAGRFLGVTVGAIVGLPTGGAGALVLAGLAASVGADFVAGAIRQRRFAPQLKDAILRDINSNSRIKNDFLKEATPTNRKFLEEEFLKLPPAPEGAPRASVNQPINLPKRAGGGVQEKTKSDAIRRSDSEPKPTVATEAIIRDRNALEQAISEVDGNINALRGDNTLVRTADGEYYRFKTLPSWVPDDMRDGNMLNRAIKNIEQGISPKPDTKLARVQDMVQDMVDSRVAQIKSKGAELIEGVFSKDAPFAIALVAGGTYYLMSSDGELAPVFAIGAMASPTGRRVLAKQGNKVSKLPGEAVEETLDALIKFESKAATVKVPSRMVAGGQLEMLQLGNSDAMFRLDQLKAKNSTRALSNDEIVEARVLLEAAGELKPFNQGEIPNLTTDPDLRTNRAVPMKDVAGQKFTVPANTVIKPKLNEKGNAVITVDGKSYTVPKNQYDNLKGQSTRAVASPFAPELKGTVETVKAESKTASFNMEDYEKFPSDVTKIMEKYGDDSWAIGEALIKRGYEVVTEGDGTITSFYKKGTSPAKYSQYTLDGGENYREILIQAPTVNGEKALLEKGYTFKEMPPVREGFAKTWSIYKDGKVMQSGYDSKKAAIESFRREAGNYQSSHWSEPNVISHIRMNERTVDGKKYAFMEELQSDWARDARTGKDTPQNPLLKDWQIPTTKRALIEAVDSGADRFAWINGEQTSARYNLATHVENVLWKKQASNPKVKSITITPKEGSKSISFPIDEKGVITESPTGQADWKGKKLDEVLGKGLADKIMEKKTGTLSGDGLSFGGEWAKNLYDKQVRDIVKNLTGAEVKTVDMGLGSGKKESGWIDLVPSDIKVGATLTKGTPENYAKWTVTEVLPDGRFKAIPKNIPDILKDEIKEKTFDLSTRAVQQYIELTPEVKAKIQSKAPKFKMKDGVNVAMPLLVAYFYAESE